MNRNKVANDDHHKARLSWVKSIINSVSPFIPIIHMHMLYCLWEYLFVKRKLHLEVVQPYTYKYLAYQLNCGARFTIWYQWLFYIIQMYSNVYCMLIDLHFFFCCATVSNFIWFWNLAFRVKHLAIQSTISLESSILVLFGAFHYFDIDSKCHIVMASQNNVETKAKDNVDDDDGERLIRNCFCWNKRKKKNEW